LQLKSTLGDAGKREQALKEARAKVAELKAELGRKTADLRRKSGELKKLAEESAHRAAAIIRGDVQDAAEPVEAEPAAPPASAELGSESHPGRQANTNIATRTDTHLSIVALESSVMRWFRIASIPFPNCDLL
jgi:hypothetical protein